MTRAARSCPPDIYIVHLSVSYLNTNVVRQFSRMQRVASRDTYRTDHDMDSACRPFWPNPTRLAQTGHPTRDSMKHRSVLLLWLVVLAESLKGRYRPQRPDSTFLQVLEDSHSPKATLTQSKWCVRLRDHNLNPMGQPHRNTMDLTYSCLNQVHPIYGWSTLDPDPKL